MIVNFVIKCKKSKKMWLNKWKTIILKLPISYQTNCATDRCETLCALIGHIIRKRKDIIIPFHDFLFLRNGNYNPSYNHTKILLFIS